jgi:hypothetical protein
MISAALFALLLTTGPQELMVPEGTILPVVLNETLNTKKVQENDPILLTLADDVRAAGRRGPVLIPRGSSVVGRIVKSERAGHFIGHSHLDIKVQEISTPSGAVYDLTAKIIDIGKMKGKKGEVNAEGVINGPGHTGRDTFFLLFPPTTLFQLLATPKRGPDVVIPVETRVFVKLMTPIYVETQTASTTVPSPAAIPFSQVAPVPQLTPQLGPPQVVPQFIPSSFAPQPVGLISSGNLDILVSPVALYPDAVLRELLIAATHPSDIIQANAWVHQFRNEFGSLPPIGYNANWDSSVKAMTAYPDLLQRLSSDIDWTARLGNAYSTQPAEMIAAIQRIRNQAHTLRTPATASVSPIRY